MTLRLGVAEKPEIKPVEPDLGNTSVGNRLIPFLCLISKEAVAIWKRLFYFVPESGPFQSGRFQQLSPNVSMTLYTNREIYHAIKECF